MPVRTTASFPIIIHEYASSESSASPRISDAALSSTDYPLHETNLAGDLEQLEDLARPMTSGAEDDPMQETLLFIDSSSQTC